MIETIYKVLKWVTVILTLLLVLYFWSVTVASHKYLIDESKRCIIVPKDKVEFWTPCPVSNEKIATSSKIK